VINAHFVLLAVALSAFGAYSYVRDTLRGVTSPHRVTWGLWALEGILSFAIEVQEHIGLTSVMTLMLGFVPLVVVIASFRNPRSVWRIDRFDVVCGLVSASGLVFWGLVHEPTVALVSFVMADQIAAIPTVRKSWTTPGSENPRVYAMGVLNTGIALLTLRHFTTAGALFPGVVCVTDLVLATLIIGRIGPRARRTPVTQGAR
jgi:hypothetical protein